MDAISVQGKLIFIENWFSLWSKLLKYDNFIISALIKHRASIKFTEMCHARSGQVEFTVESCSGNSLHDFKNFQCSHW